MTVLCQAFSSNVTAVVAFPIIMGEHFGNIAGALGKNSIVMNITVANARFYRDVQVTNDNSEELFPSEVNS